MICLELNWLFYDPSWILQLSEFVWALRSSVWIVYNNFLLIDATDKSKISSDQKRLFFALRLYPLSFFANTPFKDSYCWCYREYSIVCEYYSDYYSISCYDDLLHLEIIISQSWHEIWNIFISYNFPSLGLI